MGRVLFCKTCGHAVTVNGEIPSVCLGCGACGRWRLDSDPTVVYTLSRQDCRFLRALHIDPEEPPPTAA